jgi:hypothetical protein
VRVFVFLHVATMFTAVSIALGPSLLLERIGHSGDVPAIRRAFGMATPLVKLIPPLYGLGAALGIVAIFTNGFNPFAPFLLIAYALFILATVVGITFNNPWFNRVVKLSAESPDAAPSPALTAALHDRTIGWVNWFDRLVIVAFVFDMIVKPFG